jgi:hypothetical protein
MIDPGPNSPSADGDPHLKLAEHRAIDSESGRKGRLMTASTAVRTNEEIQRNVIAKLKLGRSDRSQRDRHHGLSVYDPTRSARTTSYVGLFGELSPTRLG